MPILISNSSCPLACPSRSQHLPAPKHCSTAKILFALSSTAVNRNLVELCTDFMIASPASMLIITSPSKAQRTSVHASLYMLGGLRVFACVRLHGAELALIMPNREHLATEHTTRNLFGCMPPFG